jgi:hypothetical protein
VNPAKVIVHEVHLYNDIIIDIKSTNNIMFLLYSWHGRYMITATEGETILSGSGASIYRSMIVLE